MKQAESKKISTFLPQNLVISNKSSTFATSKGRKCVVKYNSKVLENVY